MYFGITVISVSKAIQRAGIYTSIVGFVYIVTINIYTVYLLLKARNRFKSKQITDICDLTAELYGESKRKYMIAALVGCNIRFLVLFLIYFGE